MFTGNKITITETDITGWSDDLVADKNRSFYLERYAAVQETLVAENCIHCLPLDNKFGTQFAQSPPYILFNKNAFYQNIYKATNYGMVIYAGFDPARSLFNIDTQSLYFCTKVVVITETHIADIHFPIDEAYLSDLSDENIHDFIALLKHMGINLAESKWYTVSGNLRDVENGSLKEINVSKQFVAKLLNSLENDFGFSRENLTEIDMQIKLDYQVDPENKSLIPTALNTPSRETSYDSQSGSSDSIQSRTSVSSFSSWSSEELECEEKTSINTEQRNEKTTSKNKTASPLLKNAFINSMEKKTELPISNLEQPAEEPEAISNSIDNQSNHSQLTNQETIQQDDVKDSHSNVKLTRSPRPELESLTPRPNKKPNL